MNNFYWTMMDKHDIPLGIDLGLQVFESMLKSLTENYWTFLRFLGHTAISVHGEGGQTYQWQTNL